MGIRVNSKAKVQEVSKKHKMKTETYVEKKDSCVAAQQTPIKYNVIGKIESLKIQQLSGKHKRRNKKQNVVEQKSTKEKIIEKKKNKAINKSKKKLKNLLKESGKSKMPSKLVNFCRICKIIHYLTNIMFNIKRIIKNFHTVEKIKPTRKIKYS
ncbi:hypothetical protein HHI36_005510 [Cryptolaemus montrouzieri]|uniref:Uncharacterized protein n=1 Tax=Cryptolaemus montrouzieri TaxID=559131 RepID=A0ABD2NUU5_9CUCU